MSNGLYLNFENRVVGGSQVPIPIYSATLQKILAGKPCGGAVLKDGIYIKSRQSDDVITGSNYGDFIQAGDGDDIINSSSGDNTIRAGQGDDFITLGKGENLLHYSRDLLKSQHDTITNFDDNDRIVIDRSLEALVTLDGVGSSSLQIKVANQGLNKGDNSVVSSLSFDSDITDKQISFL